MKTASKNAIVKMIEAMNEPGMIYNFEIRDVRSKTMNDRTKDWGFSVFQVEHKEDGEVRFRDILSDPSGFMAIAKAMGEGAYISVDTCGREPEDWNEKQRSTWGKPYIRFY